MSKTQRECACGRRIVAKKPGGNGFYVPQIDHDLCFKCFQAEVDRNRAKKHEDEACSQ